MSMKISCDEATKICDKNQYGEMSFLERLKLKFHLFLCKKCGNYSKHNGVLTKCLDKHRKCEDQKSKCLEEEEKINMKEEIEANI